MFMLFPYGDGVGDAEPRHTSPKDKTISTDRDPGMCLSLLMLCDSMIGLRFFHLIVVINLFLKDECIIICVNHAMMICLDV